MGTDDLFKKARKKREVRKSSNKHILDNILILCEGEKTEPNYFNSIKRKFKLSNVDIRGLGSNTDKITESAIKNHKDYSQVWCVFDRDSFKSHHFNRAFQMIEKYKNIHIAYSNEAFELWYLLHFNYYNTGISRKRYFELLSELLGKKYEKNSPEIYNLICDKENTAIKNAKRLLKLYTEYNPEKNNPSTTVFELVEELNKFKNTF
jgi:hypothetical protein